MTVTAHARTKTALVLGATGVSGRAIVTHLDQCDDWDVIAVARKPPTFTTKARFVPVDLLDPANCRAGLGGLTEVTHVFYTAYVDNPVIAETRLPNATMFANAMSVIAAAENLRHVCLLQGTKYYGHHLGPFKTPAKEDDPRVGVPHFYYDQQDLLMTLREGKAWSWSCARPHVICGFALGNPLNLIAIIAVYATLRREMGEKLTFPGKPGAFTSICQATDAGLLARAMTWMATTPACADQAFNVTNGDFFRYRNLWPRFAEYFDMAAGGVDTVNLARTMGGEEERWSAIVRKCGLAQHSLSRLVNWNFADYVFACDWDVMSDTTKCREYGFLEFIDSEKMFFAQFDILRAKKIIP
jgi:nucleoside-diphosphate-sugar epimerase